MLIGTNSKYKETFIIYLFHIIKNVFIHFLPKMNDKLESAEDIL